MRSFFVLLLLGALLGTLALVVRAGLLARHNPGQPINAAMREAMNQTSPQWSAEDEKLIGEKFPGAHKTPSGLLYIVRQPGQEGPVPTMGSRVTVNYEGRFLDGKKFDSSADRGGAFTFTVGIGKVIKGWDEAFLSMKQGEKRTLIIPYWLGYGDTSRPAIPPKSTLVFDVELVSFR
ncbi:MAG: FKBP-type peptidyl-prolyl cis-trans isomerase [Nibricoccus sp.]